MVIGALLLVLIAIPTSIPGLQTTSYGGWPAIGFAVALFVVAGRRRVISALLAETLVLGVTLTFSYGVPVWLGFTGSLSVTLPSLLSWRLLTRAGRAELGIVQVDTIRYHFATLAAALVCGVGAALTTSLLQPRDALLAGLMSTLSALTAQLVVLPLLMRSANQRPLGGPVERWVQRIALVTATVLVFLPDNALPTAFLVLPLLGWAALRVRPREAHLQLLAVSMVAYAATFADRGPMASRHTGFPDTIEPLLLYLFIAAACYLIVPVTLTVEQLFAMTSQAARSSTTVEQLIESATHTVFIATDERGLITHYNPGAARTLGYPLHEVLGRSPAMFHTPEEIQRQSEHFGVEPDHTAVALAQASSGSRRDWAFRHRDGSDRMISLSLSRVTDPQGRAVGYIAAGEDITERMRAQNALSTALAREHAAVVRLQEVDHVKQELVSNVSHELRTPITSIAGYAELLADHALGELNRAQSDAVQRIERNTTRLGLLVEDLLTMSRAESGQLHLDRHPLDLRDIAGEAYEMLEELVRTRDLEVELQVPDEPVTMMGDRHALERVAMNLLNNAVKFTPDGGRAVLAVRRAPEGPALVVTDTGLGMSEEDQRQLFTRFFRAAEVTERAIQGTGLGLSIVHAIVTQHGGSVSVDSEPGRGTTITALFPSDDQRD
jgi:PAS domain S-box-containing protein